MTLKDHTKEKQTVGLSCQYKALFLFTVQQLSCLLAVHFYSRSIKVSGYICLDKSITAMSLCSRIDTFPYALLLAAL